MKKLLLSLIAVVACLQVAVAQQAACSPFLGYWKSDQTSVAIVVYEDINGNCQIMQWDYNGNEVIVVSNLKVGEEGLRFDSYTPSTDFKVTSVCTLVGRDKMREVITNPHGVFTVDWERATR